MALLTLHHLPDAVSDPLQLSLTTLPLRIDGASASLAGAYELALSLRVRLDTAIGSTIGCFMSSNDYGRRRPVFLTGPAGSGKTHLAAAFAEHVAAAGGTVLWIAPHSTELPDEFNVVITRELRDVQAALCNTYDLIVIDSGDVLLGDQLSSIADQAARRSRQAIVTAYLDPRGFGLSPA